MKNVVVFGGGTGLSNLLSGLKLFPVNVTAVISVADDGRSTGTLKIEGSHQSKCSRHYNTHIIYYFNHFDKTLQKNLIVILIKFFKYFFII